MLLAKKLTVFSLSLLILSCSSSNNASDTSKSEFSLSQQQMEVTYNALKDCNGSLSPIKIKDGYLGLYKNIKLSEKMRNNAFPAYVLAEILVEKDGKASSVSIKESTNNRLNKPIVRAVKETNFEPGTCNGIPVDMYMNFPFSFNADDAKS